MERFYKALGEIMRNLRKSKQYSTIDIAEKLGISPRTYRNLESGQRMFTVTQLEGLGEIFNVNWIDIIDEAVRIMDVDGLAKEEITPILDMVQILYEKARKERESREEKIKDCIIDLIRLTERSYTPNKHLSNDDIYDLGDMILNLVNTRVEQLLRKVDRTL